MTRVAAPAPSANKVFDVVEEMPQFAGGSGSNGKQFLDKVQVRENLNETAFFYPALERNNGNVAIRFTLPESVTIWKFMGWLMTRRCATVCWWMRLWLRRP